MFVKNEPQLFRTDISQWPIVQEWLHEGGLNFEHLMSEYGHLVVPVSQCDLREFSDTKCFDMSMSQFLTAINKNHNHSEPNPFYLKNWHLCRETSRYDWYEQCIDLQFDWLDWYTRERGIDDYRFVYLGADGSWTPLHADVYRSYSWSTNICGRKKWTFIRPDQTQYLLDKFGREMIYDIRDVCPNKFPMFHLVEPVIIFQDPGETIFVPSNWFHQVENIGVALSVNQNFINAFNIVSCAHHFAHCWQEVLESISHLKSDMAIEDFVSSCQQIQKQHFGMDSNDFLEFISHMYDVIVCGSYPIERFAVNAQICHHKSLKQFSLSQLAEAKRVVQSSIF